MKNDSFPSSLLLGILICLIVIAFKSFDVNVSPANVNLSGYTNQEGKEVIQLAPNRIAVVDNMRNSGMEGTILVFDYNSETKKFDYSANMNYADYFRNPDQYGLLNPQVPYKVIPVPPATPKVSPKINILIDNKELQYVTSYHIYETNEKRLKSVSKLDDIINSRTCKYSTNELIDILREKKISCGPIFDVAQAFNSSEINELDIVGNTDNLKYIKTPINFL